MAAVMDLIPRPIDAEGFAPFGTLLAPPDPGGPSLDHVADIGNLRTNARLNVSITRAAPTPLPLSLGAMERHPYSSQAFVPRVPCTFSVLVAPRANDGTPDTDRMRAFLSRQGVVYAPNVWHHPFLAIGGACDCLMLRWDDGSDRDTEWHTLEPGIRLLPPASG